ncbi:ankyrin repeat-containing domain protein [Exophiala viscosa]|uniref:Ankyrin repeat-containing domain protein n=1 Tax=Exophiala viscosa TaxID=2486360 RepID=A0AAN6ID02_9EURO|nr:ankyrin repeat-containing domain protein [Exophiala viscosa]
MAETKENKYAIHEAAREGRIQVVDSLLSANPKLASLVDQDERLPIHWACAFNHLDIVKLLTSTRSFDPDAQDGSGWTPLAIAASLKDNSGEEIIELLLSKEADAKIPTNSGATALHFAVSKDTVQAWGFRQDKGQARTIAIAQSRGGWQRSNCETVTPAQKSYQCD